MRRAHSILAAGLTLAVACGDPAPQPAPSGLRAPELGPIPDLAEWPDNPSTEAKQILGQALFLDGRLSGTGRMSCSGCHFPGSAFQSTTELDAPDRSSPEIQPVLPRNTPSLLNLAYAPVFRWDGGHGSKLETQMVIPFAEANMNLTVGVARDDVHTVEVPSAQRRLAEKLTTEIPGYVPLFQEAFGVDIRTETAESIWSLTGKAMAIFMRRVISRNAPFDRWNAGEDDAISVSAVRGLELFRGKARCVGCHFGPFLSDFSFHNLSTERVRADGTRKDEGRFLVTGEERDRGRFLTPTLRHVAQTGPYLHDGRFLSLRDVIRHKTTDAARRDPGHDIALDDAETLSDAEVEDLVELLKTFTGAALPTDVRRPSTTAIPR